MLAEVRARQRTAPPVQHRGRSADARLVADDLLDLPGLAWQPAGDATFSCPVSWHGERGELLLELGGPGPAMLSLIGARGVLWTRPLALPALR